MMFMTTTLVGHRWGMHMLMAVQRLVLTICCAGATRSAHYKQRVPTPAFYKAAECVDAIWYVNKTNCKCRACNKLSP